MENPSEKAIGDRDGQVERHGELIGTRSCMRPNAIKYLELN